MTLSLEQKAREEVAGLWQDLLDVDDRTSPAEYPEMCLITFEEFRAAFLAGYRARQVEEEWRPISEAPKDGTPILGWRKGWERPGVVAYFGSYWCWDLADAKIIPSDSEPTHFKPLPAPPVTTPKEG